MIQDLHESPDLAGLTAICEAEAKLAGRKAILYFGQSTQVDDNTLDQFRATIRAANLSGVSIYAVDMNALDEGANQAMLAGMSVGNVRSSNGATAMSVSTPRNTGPPPDAGGFHSLLGPAGARAMADTMTDLELNNAEGRQSAFAQLAFDTGGRYTSANSGLKRFTKQMVSELTNYYEATYSSPTERYDGSLRPVVVKALRRSLVIHAPSGYLVSSKGQPSVASTLDASLLRIFNQADVPGSLAYRDAALPLDRTAEGRLTELVVEAPLESLEIREDPNPDLYSYHVRVGARVETPGGKIVAEFSEDIHRRGRLEKLELDRQGTVVFERRAALPAGQYRLITALADVNSEAFGRQAQTFEVPSGESEPAVRADAAPHPGKPAAETTLMKTERPPSAEATLQWIDAARRRALGYLGKLPNFICFESIDRSMDRSGKGRWTHRDTISELLTYRDKKKSRMVLAVNGSRVEAEHADLRGPRSNGEYGGLLQLVFDPAAEAHFEWQGETQVSGTTVQVFRYQIAQGKSAFSLTDAKLSSVHAAIHGLVAIEPETGGMRSISVEADDLPADFAIRASSISLVYDYVSINHHDYLVPVQGEVILKEGKHHVQWNRLAFRAYHRFASQSRILSSEPLSETLQ